MGKNTCQIFHIEEMGEEVGKLNFLWQRLKKIKHAIRRRLNFIRRRATSRGKKYRLLREKIENASSSNNFQPGDLVRVRSRAEIESTLDEWNKLKGCAFMKEMREFCGTEQRVFKKVNRFMDERDYLIKKTDGIYLLEGVFCNGVKDIGSCDRSCFFFWRREWLQKIEP